MAGRGPLLCWSLLDRPPPPRPLPPPREFPRPPPLPPVGGPLLLSGVWLLAGALGALAGCGRDVFAVAMVVMSLLNLVRLPVAKKREEEKRRPGEKVSLFFSLRAVLLCLLLIGFPKLKARIVAAQLALQVRALVLCSDTCPLCQAWLHSASNSTSWCFKSRSIF